MNILVVSENLLYGGLETRMQDFSNYCALHGNSVWFAVNGFDEEFNRSLDIHKIYRNLDMAFSDNAKNICRVVDKLCDIIRENDIDVIEAHPFSSILPAMMAANAMQKPVVITIHGAANVLEAYNDPYYHTLVYHLCLRCADLVISTSPDLDDLLHIYTKNTLIVPNGVDTSRFKRANFSKKGPWAIVSRFDAAKIQGVMDAIEKLAHAAVKEIHLFGDFTKDTEHIKRQITALSIRHKVNILFKGHTNNLHVVLGKGYAGVVAMGRALLEAISMNIPALLVGYVGVIGLVDYDMYQAARSANFSARGMDVCSKIELTTALRQLNLDPERYQLRDRVLSEIDSTQIWDRYVSSLGHIIQTDLQSKEKIGQLHALFKCVQDQSQCVWSYPPFLCGVRDILPELNQHLT